MIIAVTGHRAGRIKESTELIEKIRNTLDEVEPERVLVGMCNGFDLMVGYEAVGRCLPVHCYVPWAGHRESKYTLEEDKRRYDHLMHFSQEVHILDAAEDYPGPHVFHNRNRAMVDNASHLLAYFDGKETGGTWSTIQYAKSKNMKVRNLYG